MTDTQDSHYDVIIIGGGPAGLSAALYAARAQLKTVVLDKNPAAGALGAAERIENYPGVPQIKGLELLSSFRNQAQTFGAEIVQTQVIGVNFEKEEKEVMTAETVYFGKTVIIATGAMGRKPTIKGEAEFLGRGVSYCAVCDAPFFKGKNVALVGEMKEIAEEIDSVAKFAANLYVIPKKVTDPGILGAYPQVTTMSGYRVVEILGTSTVESLNVTDPEGAEHILPVSGVFVFLHGTNPIVDFLYNAVNITEEGCICVDSDRATSVEGVYAAGDVTCTRVRQVIIAAAEGCTAALSADTYINKRKKVRPQWSRSAT